jgi:hypothetical protein
MSIKALIKKQKEELEELREFKEKIRKQALAKLELANKKANTPEAKQKAWQTRKQKTQEKIEDDNSNKEE